MSTSKSDSYFRWFWKQTLSKYFGIEERFVWWVGVLKYRIQRLFAHFLKPFIKQQPDPSPHKLNWLTQLIIYISEFFALPEIYESLSSLIKYNTRPLNDHELAVGLSVFGESIDLDLVRIDNRAYIGTQKGNVVYVSFHTINSWGKFSESTLIHELVHVYQYEKLGMTYIPLALAAQKSEAGYQYGGIEALKENAIHGLNAFNLEQQAAIIEDYYRLKTGLPTRYGKVNLKDIDYYMPYVKEIRKETYEA